MDPQDPPRRRARRLPRRHPSAACAVRSSAPEREPNRGVPAGGKEIGAASGDNLRRCGPAIGRTTFLLAVLLSWCPYWRFLRTTANPTNPDATRAIVPGSGVVVTGGVGPSQL